MNTETILTCAMQDFIDTQVESGTYVSTDEVIRAGVRLLMEKDGARQFYNLKNELTLASKEVEAGKFKKFNPKDYEPKAFLV